ncbi:MAG TPA: tripartite tricarboxylate transporter substrate-binding protein [Burkholderiales bacterium]|jgi:tripartite-type tricarboxylate transporter receptor subunit TctC
MRIFTTILALALSVGAQAQTFPSKTIRFISGVTPGAASDTMARILAEKMTQTLGQSVIVENRLGAGGLVGAKYVAEQAEPDGHTIMMYASAFTVSTLLSPDVLNAKEMQAVATVATIPTVMVTPPGKYKTVKDFVAAAKAQPGKLVCADAGLGSATHMAFERFRFAAGFEALNVHTKGPGEALTEVISGRADCYFALVFQAKKMHEAGKVGALVVSSPKRTPLMPDLPTTEEAGYPNSAYNFWVGALVSSKTPRAIVERLHQEITTLVQSPEISGQIKKLGADPLTMSIAEFEAMIARELKENAELIKKAGIKAN